MPTENIQYRKKKISLRKYVTYLFFSLLLLIPFLNAVWYFPVEKSYEISLSDAQLSLAENLKLRTTLFLADTVDSVANTTNLISVESEEAEVKKILARLFKTNSSHRRSCNCLVTHPLLS